MFTRTTALSWCIFLPFRIFLQISQFTKNMSIRRKMKMMVPFCFIFMVILLISFCAKLNNLDLQLASKQRISDVKINHLKKQIKSFRSQINCDEDQISCGKNRTALLNFLDGFQLQLSIMHIMLVVKAMIAILLFLSLHVLSFHLILMY